MLLLLKVLPSTELVLRIDGGQRRTVYSGDLQNQVSRFFSPSATAIQLNKYYVIVIARDTYLTVILLLFITTVIRLNQFTSPVVEMGRHELYAELPFVAVLGLQKQERRLSMAWSNAAALLEDEELETNALITSDEKSGMEDPNYEKDERVRRMSVILLDDLEGTDGVYLTLPLVVAVMIASMFTFNGKVVHIPVLSLWRVVFLCAIVFANEYSMYFPPFQLQYNCQLGTT